MIPIRHKITRRGPEFTAKAWRDNLREAWEHVANFWFRTLLPKHFTQAGASEYRYKTRDPKYNRRKQRVQGHRRPLVFSGNLERVVKRIRDVRSTAKGAKVVLHGPRYLFAFRKRFNQPDKARELATISTKDAETLAKVMDRFLQRRIDAENKIVDISRGHRRGVA